MWSKRQESGRRGANTICHPVSPEQSQGGAYGILGLAPCGADLEICIPPLGTAVLRPRGSAPGSACMTPGREDWPLMVHP